MVGEVPRPAGRRFKAAGARLWDSVLADYELETHEEAMLTQACRTVHILEALHRIIALEGPMLVTEAGARNHPAVVEARQQRIALARLLAALRLPAGDEQDAQANRRPQRRSGARGVYQMKDYVS